MVTTLLALIVLLTPLPSYHMTYADLQRFLAQDQTNTMQWSENEIGCIQFSETLVRNAQQRGFYATAVRVYLNQDPYGNIYGHEFTEFWTVDRGIVWIEPQTDEEYYIRSPGQKFCTVKGECWEGSLRSVTPILVNP